MFLYSKFYGTQGPEFNGPNRRVHSKERTYYQRVYVTACHSAMALQVSMSDLVGDIQRRVEHRFISVVLTREDGRHVTTKMNRSRAPHLAHPEISKVGI